MIYLVHVFWIDLRVYIYNQIVCNAKKNTSVQQLLIVPTSTWHGRYGLVAPDYLIYSQQAVLQWGHHSQSVVFFQQITQNQCNSQDLFAHKPCSVAYELPA